MSDHPLYSPAFFREVQEKCARAEWAGKALRKLTQQAEACWENPIHIPLLGGGWSHDYNCPNEGDKLIRIDRHHHRCPTCSSVWSGSPWDEVAVSNEHHYYSSSARIMAVLYAITGELRALEWARTVLIFYAEHYETFALHDRFGGASKTSGKVMCQSLSESSWIMPFAQAYVILKEYQAWTEEESRLIEDKLLLPAAEVLDRNPMGISNWQSYHNAARAWIAAATGRRDLMEQAVHDPENGFMFQMDNSLSDDGFWYEGAWGYHFYTMVAQVQLVLAAQYMGLNLIDHPRFRSMFRAPLACMLPDGTLPPVHDSVTVYVGKHAPLFEFSSRYYGLGAKIAAASERHSLESILFGLDEPAAIQEDEERPASGFVELKRAGMIFLKQNSSSQTAMVDYGEHGGEHGHMDKLSLLYHAGGRPWLDDAGMLPYGNPVHHAYFRHTAAHNTVAINGCSQQRAVGRVIRAEQDENGWLHLETMTDEAYPGTILRRTNVLTDRLLVDVFEVFSKTAQDVDWVIHTQGLPVMQPGDVILDGDHALGDAQGYEFFKHTLIWQPEKSTFWCREWKWDEQEHSDERFEVYGLIHASDNVDEALYLAEAPAMPTVGKHSTFIRRRRGAKCTQFITLFRACREGEGRLSASLLEGEEGSIIQVVFPDGSIQEITIAGK
jgi:oligo-alginate lyase